MPAPLIAVLLHAAAVAALGSPSPQSCANLASISLPNAKVTVAEPVNSGSFTPPRNGESRAVADLPAFCRVAATLTPTPDSDIRIEVWMPLSGWNGKFQAVGNGGWGGSIDYAEMGKALQSGYATSATDDGHEGSGGSFVLGHPEKFVDFAYRSEHEMTTAAKAIIGKFYGEPAHHSYWNGCSGGGREGLIEARRYPEDFDGIIAGDPADFRRNAWALWLAQKTFKNPESYIPPAKYPVVHQAVLDACDALDGLKDGLIEDPPQCHFDPAVLHCKGEDAPNCLTAPQVEAARALLSPLRTSKGQDLFPRLEPGTELRWARLAGGPEPAALFQDLFRYVIYKNPNWDWRTFDLDRDSALAIQADKDVTELNPDLARFAARGGKLLIYHGWADQQVAPTASVEFYDAAAKLSGGTENASSWMRLFMAPGMAHCSGGEGPDTFDKIGALEQWVEHAHPPARIVASHSTTGKVDRTRPLCPYPQTAHYKGSGSIDQAENFVCK